MACEAVLCLSSGTRPSECAPSLSHYFSIHKKVDTIRARFDFFLNLCPVSNQTPEMNSLISAISNGAGRCDAASLNTTLRTWWVTGTVAMSISAISFQITARHITDMPTRILIAAEQHRYMLENPSREDTGSKQETMSKHLLITMSNREE